MEGYTSGTLDERKSKLLHYPAGTVFRRCPQDFNPFDAFSPGQREEMFDDLAGALSGHSMSVVAYSEEKCVPGASVK